MSDVLKRTHQQLVEGELEEGHFRGEGQQAGDQAQRIGPGILHIQMIVSGEKRYIKS